MSRNLPTNVSLGSAAAVVAAIFCLTAVSPVVEAAVGPNPVDPSGTFPTNGRLVFRNPRGLQQHYAFFLSAASGNWVYRSSPDGSTWSDAQVVIDTGIGSASLWISDIGTLLVVYFVANSPASLGNVRYRRGTIPDSSVTIMWSPAQTIEQTTYANYFGLSITRTDNGRPVITAVSELVGGDGTYSYEVRAWGADQDTSAPVWTRISLMAPYRSLGQPKIGGYTSVYSAGLGNYIFVGASAARGYSPEPLPWDVSWLAAIWDGNSWVKGSISILSHSESAARPITVVVDENHWAHALVVYPTNGNRPPLSHYHAYSVDGSMWQIYTVSTDAVTSATLTIDLSSETKNLRAMYHYGTRDIRWKTTPIGTISWSSENTIPWSQDATDFSSSQRDFVGRMHALVESSGGVFYLGL